MTVITTYKEPIDLYKKLVREGGRVWRTESIEDKSDHFFNFCVTSLSIRDWCIKYLNLDSVDTNKFYKIHSDSTWLNYCACIANQSKHFALKPDRKSSVHAVSDTYDTLIPIFPDGKWHEELSFERHSLEILTDTDLPINLMKFLISTCFEWENLFKTYNIECPNEYFKQTMFIEMYYP